jgi:hypothetical protein
MGLKRLQILGSMGKITCKYHVDFEDVTAVQSGLLSKHDCCPIVTAVKPGLLSKRDCCPSGTAVKLGLLSNQDCCQTWTAVQT